MKHLDGGAGGSWDPEDEARQEALRIAIAQVTEGPAGPAFDPNDQRIPDLSRLVGLQPPR